jgi:hypothetical protein
MAASGFTPIQLYYSVTSTNVPLAANLVYGELALNAADGKMYFKSTAGGGTVVKIADAATATGSVTGGTAGALVYQSAPSTSAFVNIGTSTYILTSNGTVPVYTNPASITVGLATLATSATTAGSATTATTATNLAGGTAYQLAYQSAAGTTTFAPAPSTVGYVLGWSGSAFTWVVAPASVSAINLVGGGANTIVYQSSAGTTAYLTNGTTGQVLGANTGGAPSWVTGGTNAYTRTTYTATASQTTFAVTYTVGYVQVYLNGVMLTAVDYTATSGTSVVLTIGAALNDIVEFLAFNTTLISTTSTSNLLGGTTGQVPYQSAPGATAFTGPGAAGGVFYSAGASTPSFTTAGTTGQALVSAGASAPAFGTLPIAGGGTNSTATPTAGGVVYGTGTAQAYSAVGTTGQALVSAGASAPAFGTLSVVGGGTGQTSYTDGQLLIGNSTGNTLTKTTLTAGTGISITNGSGAITIASSTNAAAIPIGTDIAVTDYSLTMPAAIAAATGSIVKTQTIALDATKELLLFVGASNLQAVVYDSSAGTFGSVVLVRTAAFTPQINDFAASLISSTSVLVCSIPGFNTTLSTVVLSISGSTITVNTAVATTLAASSYFIAANTRLTTVGSSYVLNYYTTADNLPKFRAITVSGTTPTVGAELAYAGGTDLHHSYAYTSSVLLHLSCDTTTLYAYPISVSGSTLTGGTATTITISPSTAAVGFVSGVLSTGRIAVAYQTGGGGTVSVGVITVTGTVASKTTAGSFSSSGTGPQMQVFSNQAFVYGGTGSSSLNVLTDTAGVASVGTNISLSFLSMVGFLSTGKIFLSSTSTNNNIYYQYGISSGSAILEKRFDNAGTATTTAIGNPYGGNYKFPLSGPPNSGNYYAGGSNNLSLRTSTGKTCSMQSGVVEFVTSIDGNYAAKLQQSGITLPDNSVSDALSTATGWYVYSTLSTTSLTLLLRKMVLS